MSSEKKIIEWESLSKWEMGVMVIMLPIFAVVAGLEHVIAKLTGATYNEVNIIVYYLLILWLTILRCCRFSRQCT